MADLTEKEINEILEAANKRKPKKKMEFSKKWLLGCALFTVVFITLSYVLAAFDKNPLESLSSEIIRVLGAVDGISFAGYNLQNSVRAYSVDKYCAGNEAKEE